MSTDTESGGSQGMGGRNGASWIAALVGIWVLITPFFWGATGSSGGWWGGGGVWLYWSNVISGIVIAILAGYAAQSGNSQAGWLAALVGLWVLITPFFWGLAVGGGLNWWAASGLWLYWSNIISGIVVAVLAGYSAQSAGASSGSSATA